METSGWIDTEGHFKIFQCLFIWKHIDTPSGKPKTLWNNSLVWMAALQGNRRFRYVKLLWFWVEGNTVDACVYERGKELGMLWFWDRRTLNLGADTIALNTNQFQVTLDCNNDYILKKKCIKGDWIQMVFSRKSDVSLTADFYIDLIIYLLHSLLSNRCFRWNWQVGKTILFKQD